MLPVNFKKLQCPLLLFLNVPVDFKVVQGRLSNSRKCHATLSNLRVKGPSLDQSLEVGMLIGQERDPCPLKPAGHQ